MKNNIENHIDSLHEAILIDRKKGNSYSLKYVTKELFIAEDTIMNKQSVITLSKISKGLSVHRYRILTVK